jgi:hypothetical protein
VRGTGLASTGEGSTFAVSVVALPRLRQPARVSPERRIPVMFLRRTSPKGLAAGTYLQLLCASLLGTTYKHLAGMLPIQQSSSFALEFSCFDSVIS